MRVSNPIYTQEVVKKGLNPTAIYTPGWKVLCVGIWCWPRPTHNAEKAPMCLASSRPSTTTTIKKSHYFWKCHAHFYCRTWTFFPSSRLIA